MPLRYPEAISGFRLRSRGAELPGGAAVAVSGADAPGAGSPGAAQATGEGPSARFDVVHPVTDPSVSRAAASAPPNIRPLCAATSRKVTPITAGETRNALPRRAAARR